MPMSLFGMFMSLLGMSFMNTSFFLFFFFRFLFISMNVGIFFNIIFGHATCHVNYRHNITHLPYIGFIKCTLLLLMQWPL
jgi:hypothetical protein